MFKKKIKIDILMYVIDADLQGLLDIYKDNENVHILVIDENCTKFGERCNKIMFTSYENVSLVRYRALKIYERKNKDRVKIEVVK